MEGRQASSSLSSTENQQVPGFQHHDGFRAERQSSGEVERAGLSVRFILNKAEQAETNNMGAKAGMIRALAAIGGAAVLLPGCGSAVDVAEQGAAPRGGRTVLASPAEPPPPSAGARPAVPGGAGAAGAGAIGGRGGMAGNTDGAEPLEIADLTGRTFTATRLLIDGAPQEEEFTPSAWVGFSLYEGKPHFNEANRCDSVGGTYQLSEGRLIVGDAFSNEDLPYLECSEDMPEGERAARINNMYYSKPLIRLQGEQLTISGSGIVMNFKLTFEEAGQAG